MRHEMEALTKRFKKSRSPENTKNLISNSLSHDKFIQATTPGKSFYSSSFLNLSIVYAHRQLQYFRPFSVFEESSSAPQIA